MKRVQGSFARGADEDRRCSLIY